jgi:3-oxoacyl-[acyl-carrier-protein] synthase-3
MAGRAIFEFMLTTVPDDIARACAANGIEQDEIDLYLLHQASNHMLSQLVRRTGIDPERVPIRIGQTGNLVSSSIPFLIADLAREGALSGRTTLLSGFGVGLSWATGVVRFDADPIA